MLDTNHAHSNPDEHWEELWASRPHIPATTAEVDTDWGRLGIHYWNLTVATGKFGDDTSEIEEAREGIAELDDLRQHLSARDYREFSDGMIEAQRSFFWFGL